MSNYNIISSQNDLYHHGIIGQKWGVRRYQNSDGTLTNAGKRRYGTIENYNQYNLKKKEYKTALKEYKKDQYNRNKYYNKFKKSNDYDVIKTKIKDDVLKNKINTNKNERRKNLEKIYIEKGYSVKEAELAAYKREKTEKALLVIGGVALTAIAAKTLYNKHADSVDRIIDSKTILKRISSNQDMDVKDAFYAAYKRSDVDKYKGLLAGNKKIKGIDQFQKKIKITDQDGLKVASKNSAIKILNDLCKNDKDFKRHLEDSIEFNPMIGLKQNVIIAKGKMSLYRGKIDKNVYDAFNFSLAGDSTSNTRKYYDALKSKGYGAIQDVNDKKLSGFDAKDPLIIFDKSKVKVDSVETMTWSKIGKNVLLENGRVMAKAYAMPVSALIGAEKATTTYNKNKIISDYRKKHPNSDLENYEILDSYYNKQYDKITKRKY